MKPAVVIVVIAASLLAAGAAAAEPMAPAMTSSLVINAPRTALDAGSAIPAQRLLAEAVRPRGVARTAVDHSFDRRGLVGSAGFLCGLQPGADRAGAAAASGFDPRGRFLGAKLTLAFH